jgi:hypothetical protein
MQPNVVLRLEGLAVLGIALVGYFTLGGPIWLLAVLALAPDIGMIGYLGGPRVGSVSYNSLHTYLGPVGLGSVGIFFGMELPLLVALIWAGHIGADRLVGYGLKYPSGFKDTHLSRMSAAVEPVAESVSSRPPHARQQ